MISSRPSSTLESSSGDALAMRCPIRSVASVRIWLILIHDRLGKPRALDSSVRGNSARGSLLVSATAITVPERSLKTSWLRISTGRRPACSRPRTGLRSAQRISPLSIRAKSLGSLRDPLQREHAPRVGQASSTRSPSVSGPFGPTCRPLRSRLPGFGWQSAASRQAGPALRPDSPPASQPAWSWPFPPPGMMLYHTWNRGGPTLIRPPLVKWRHVRCSSSKGR